MDRVRQFEIGVSIFIIAVCCVVIYESLDLPPGSFEPLGSAPVPQATSGLIIVLSLLVIVSALRRPVDSGPRGPEEETPDEPVSAMLLASATLLYVLLLHFRAIDFGSLTAIYLFALISALERFRSRSLIGAAIVAVICGYGIQFLFTKVFVVDLPAV